MFTGLVEEVGRVRQLNRKGEYQLVTIDAQNVLEDLKPGDSISINGVCQTVIKTDKDGFSVETLAVSLQKTGLGFLKKNMRVNLERPLSASSRIGGHLLQGHVDGLGHISAIRRKAENIYLEIILPKELQQLCVARGSIAVEGISLTIAEVRGARITINIIPTTWENTVLKERKIGDRVNIEADIMARYMVKLLGTQFQKERKGEYDYE